MDQGQKTSNSMDEKKDRVIWISVIALFLMVISLWVFSWLVPSQENNENRVLAKSPTLNFSEGYAEFLKSVVEFPDAFEVYFEDNFAFKNTFTRVYSYITLKLLQSPPKPFLIVGEDGWLFYDSVYQNDGDIMTDYYSNENFDENFVSDVTVTLEKLNGILQEQNIEFFLFIAPNKVTIYDEKLPLLYNKTSHESRVKRVMKEISEKTQIKALFLDDALKTHKQEFELYYKYGTHWNAVGAYYGMEAMKAKMDPSYQAKSIDSCTVTEEVRAGVDSWYPLLSLAGMDGAPYYEVVTENRTLYPPTEIESDPRLLAQYPDTMIIKTFQSENPNAKSLLVLHDSFGEAYMNLLPSEYSTATFVHASTFSQTVLDIVKPDVVCYERVERGIAVLPYIWSN